MSEIKSKTIKADSNLNDPDNLWEFVVETEEGETWKLNSLKRSFPAKLYENGISKVTFRPIDIVKRDKPVEGLSVVITISEKDVAPALSDPTVFENKEAIITYDDSKDLSNFLSKEETSKIGN